MTGDKGNDATRKNEYFIFSKGVDFVNTQIAPESPERFFAAYLPNRFFPNRFFLEQYLLTQSILAKHFLLRQPLRRHFPRFP